MSFNWFKLFAIFLVVFTCNVFGQDTSYYKLIIDYSSSQVYKSSLKETEDALTLNLKFSQPCIGCDNGEGTNYVIFDVEGTYVLDSDTTVSYPLYGVYSYGVLNLYVLDDSILNQDFIIYKGKYAFDTDGHPEINFKEKFMFSRQGDNFWTTNEGTYVIDPFLTETPDVIKTIFYLENESGDTLDLNETVSGYEGYLPSLNEEIIYSSCYQTQSEVRLLYVKYHDYSCWNDYKTLVTLVFNKDSRKVLFNSSKVIEQCDSIFSVGYSGVVLEGKRYVVSSAVYEKDEVELGSFRVVNGRLEIIEDWN